MASKKGLTTGRFGPRYGTRVRKAISEIEKMQKQKHECPVCRYKKVKRVGYAIWLCKKCGAKFAGGAYKPKVGLIAPIPVLSEEKKTLEGGSPEGGTEK